MKARNFFITLALLVLASVVIDIAIGKSFDKLVSSAKGGDTARFEYINRRTTDSLLVFGSSRANHHYDPRILTDSLRLSAFNCGSDGGGVLLAYMELTNILERHTPKVIIYDLYGQFDFMREADLTKYLGNVRPYYGRGNEALDSVFHQIDSAERYKMLSSSYRYNSRFIQIVSDNVKPLQSDLKGFRPQEGTLSEGFKEMAPWPTAELDPLKIEYLRRFMERCRQRGIDVIVTISPYAFKSPDEQLPPEVARILKVYKVPVLDHSADAEFLGNRNYFSDTNHLNGAGAEVYTRKVASEVKQIMNR